MNICQCSQCGLVQLANKPVDYYRDVIRASGISKEMRTFRIAQFKEWIAQNHLENKKILEVGCGNGEYLSLLKEAGGNAFGLEHNESSVNNCKAQGLNVETGFFETGTEILENKPFGAFLILNWLEHIPNINLFLRGIHDNLTPDAVGIVEVPNFTMMSKKGLITEFSSEHLFYFSEKTLSFALESCGFEVMQCRPIWHDYILSANVQKRKTIETKTFSDTKKAIVNQLDSFAKRHRKLAVWGAGHQALAVLCMANISKKIQYVVDSSPQKQNHFTFATHIPIVVPEQLKASPVDALMIICGGYSDEVARLVQNRSFPKMSIAILREDKLEIIKDTLLD